MIPGQSDHLRNTFLPLRLMLIAALILASFAHTAFSRGLEIPAGYDSRAFSAQFVLPDGTLPVLCDQSGGGNPLHNSAVPCEFCSIANTALPVHPQTLSVVCHFKHVAHIVVSDISSGYARPLYRTLSQSQAPPVV